MKTFENFQPYASIERKSAIEQSRRDSLARYEREIADPWWSLSGGAVQDECGAMWAVWNQWCNEATPLGWRIFYCGEDQSEFREIIIPYNHENPVDGVVGTEIYPRKGWEHDTLITHQLMVHYDKQSGFRNNDVLNVLQYQISGLTVETKLNFWNQGSFMRPVEWIVSPTEQGSEFEGESSEIAA